MLLLCGRCVVVVVIADVFLSSESVLWVAASMSCIDGVQVERGRGIIQLYRDAGIDSDRILLKIASTWEGLQAARVLEVRRRYDRMRCSSHLYSNADAWLTLRAERGVARKHDSHVLACASNGGGRGWSDADIPIRWQNH